MTKKLTHIVFTAFIAFSLLAGNVGQALAEPMYADWTLISGINGTGTFNGAAGMPDFTFTLTEDPIPSSTQIDDNDVFDNMIWEGLFGEGDNQESLRFRSPGLDEFDNDLLTISTLTITFDEPVDPLGTWAFAVTDLEGEDAVISASLDGIPVPDAIVVSWFQQLFDSKPATALSPNLPSGFDVANVAVVAQVDTDGLLSDETFNNFDGLPGGADGTESASAWFIPNTPIDTLTITHRNRFGFGASMHVYIAVMPDADGDGVEDDFDACPDSDLSPPVVIDGCNSWVDNVVDVDGCTISDRIAMCADSASNHGRFVRCVTHLTNQLKKDGVINGQEKGAIQHCAAQANIP